MLFFFITCFSFILFYKSLPLQPLPPWAHEMRLVSFRFFCWKGSSFVRLTKFLKRNFESIPTRMNEAFIGSNNESFEQIDNTLSLLDLPELTLDCILERLPPDGLCKMASVCKSLKNRCMSSHLWDRHMKQKWGRIIGPAAYREWQWQIATRNDLGFLDRGEGRGFVNFLCSVWPWPLSFIRSKVDTNFVKRKNSSTSTSPPPSPPVDSIMSWYLAVETGKFWFPAQVYNRENGHVGFMLSCYDAELSYDSRTDTFQARYPPHGRRAVAIESGVTWDRLRAPPVDTSPHDLHISDCLNDLRPGDHIEIQWRRNKEFPYGWWYGVVGHLESCDGNESYCRCHESDMVALEFNQYTPGSRWRNTTVNRKDHREEGDGADGFYGGIRKLYTLGEISTWKRLWPTDVLE